MSQQSAIARGDALQKIGSLGLMIGALLLIVFSSMLPRVALRDFMTAWGSNVRTVRFAEFFITVGLFGIMIGAAAVYRATSARGSAWARLGFYGVVVGTVIGTISSSVMTNMAGILASWLGAPDASKASMFTASVAVMTVCGAVFAVYVLVEWLAIIFLGIGIARSQVYPRWLGFAGSALGVLTVAAVGIPLFFSGLTETNQTSFAVLATLTFVWELTVGIWVARKAW